MPGRATVPTGPPGHVTPRVTWPGGPNGSTRSLPPGLAGVPQGVRSAVDLSVALVEVPVVDEGDVHSGCTVGGRHRVGEDVPAVDDRAPLFRREVPVAGEYDA